MKQAFFRFEASPKIGAGHAIRSCVIADALTEKGWVCEIVTSAASYEFIKSLDRYKRVDPDTFYDSPLECDLLVIDHYDLDANYEKHFRSYARKIMVIDDLVNREHECDMLLDQTYGREEAEYKNLVPDHCKILTGSDYALLRKEFIELRPKALEKRRQTKEIKKILISMGGGESKNFTLKALEMVKESGFKGVLEVVLGFKSSDYADVKSFLETLPNEFHIHVDANMPQLIYEADLAIGAAGSSVWERCCLGLPSVLMITADNQKKIYENLINRVSGIYPYLREALLVINDNSFEQLFLLIKAEKIKDVFEYVGN